MSVKSIVLSKLPEGTLQTVKKLYYGGTLRSVTERHVADFKVITHLVSSGDYVIDVGANVGLYTKYLSDLVGPHGRVFSIEPIPLTFDILCSTVKKLSLKNVEPINCALSDFNGSAIMEVPLYESGGENFYEAKIVSGDPYSSFLRRVSVTVKTMDSLFLGKLNPVSFIKFDVEGEELGCLGGAANLITESKPALLVEVWGDPADSGSKACETFKLLNREGYDAWWLDGRNLRQGYSGGKSVNYFFLTSAHWQRLKGAGFP